MENELLKALEGFTKQQEQPKEDPKEPEKSYDQTDYFKDRKDQMVITSDIVKRLVDLTLSVKQSQEWLEKQHIALLKRCAGKE